MHLLFKYTTTVVAPDNSQSYGSHQCVCMWVCACVSVCACVYVRERIQVHKYMQINTVHALTTRDNRSFWVMDPISVCVCVCVCGGHVIELVYIYIIRIWYSNIDTCTYGRCTYNNIQCIAPDNSQSDGSQSPSRNGSLAPVTISKNNCYHSNTYNETITKNILF